MNRFFKIAGCLYVCFAITTAYSALSARTTPVGVRSDGGSDVETRDGSTVSSSRVVRGTYADSARVVVYTTPGCYGCEVFKRDGIPALVAAGVLVEVIDASIDPPADETIKTFPTIIAYDGDKELQRWVGPAPVSDILAVLPAAPQDYKIWDIRRWWN